MMFFFYRVDQEVPYVCVCLYALESLGNNRSLKRLLAIHLNTICLNVGTRLPRLDPLPIFPESDISLIS